MEVKGKKVLVSGMAKSGQSAAFLLKRLGADVTAQDMKTKQELGEAADKLEKGGISLYLGKNPDDITDNMDMLVLSPGVPTDLPFIIRAKQNGIPVISEIELAYNFCNAQVIGITGTNGKTTTTSLIGEIMRNVNPKSEVVGNIGIPYCDKTDTPDDAFIVAELSSFQLETIDKFKPHVSLVLNITPDHLNRHKTLENYIKAKERIFENQTEDDYVILNYDDEVCRKMAEHTKARTVFFSHKRLEGIYDDGKSIYVDFDGINEKIIDIDEMNILGEHNVENSMAAIGAAICCGVDIDVIRKTLREFKAVEHRIEYVATIKGIDCYNDSKGTNPDAAIKAINAMKKPIVLIGGGYDKGSDFDEWIESFDNKVKFLVVIGAVSDKIIESAKKHGFDAYQKANSFEEAVKVCFEKAEKGDCILLSPACASWDMFESYEQRGKLFKEYVKSEE